MKMKHSSNPLWQTFTASAACLAVAYTISIVYLWSPLGYSQSAALSCHRIRVLSLLFFVTAIRSTSLLPHAQPKALRNLKPTTLQQCMLRLGGEQPSLRAHQTYVAVMPPSRQGTPQTPQNPTRGLVSVRAPLAAPHVVLRRSNPAESLKRCRRLYCMALDGVRVQIADFRRTNDVAVCAISC